MQKGSIKRRGDSWELRYRVKVTENGKEVWRAKSVVLAEYDPVKYRTAASVRGLADEILAGAAVNAGARPASTTTLAEFVDSTYLPWVKANRRPSTSRTYLQLWRLVRPHTNGEEMREMRAGYVNTLLQKIADKGTQDNGPLARTTLYKVKRFLSAVFKHARVLELIAHDPVRDCYIPKGGKKPQNTPAATLEQFAATYRALTGPGKLAVLVAGCTGLRVSEIKGLRWEDFDGETLRVHRSIWQGHISETKTEASEAGVPVVPYLSKALEAHRKVSAGPWIFAGELGGKPLRLENHLRRVMLPALKKAKVGWPGWHAFRRGVATILNAQGVDDKTIQTILRHSDVRTTQTHYIKATDGRAGAALNDMAVNFERLLK